MFNDECFPAHTHPPITIINVMQPVSSLVWYLYSLKRFGSNLLWIFVLPFWKNIWIVLERLDSTLVLWEVIYNTRVEWTLGDILSSFLIPIMDRRLLFAECSRIKVIPEFITRDEKKIIKTSTIIKKALVSA